MRDFIRTRIKRHTAGDAGQAWHEVTMLADCESDTNALGSCRDDGDVATILGLSVPLTPSAVLVPLIERDQGMTVLLTRRAEHLSSHSGQISFPGGCVEIGDAARRRRRSALIRSVLKSSGVWPTMLWAPATVLRRWSGSLTPRQNLSPTKVRWRRFSKYRSTL